MKKYRRNILRAAAAVLAFSVLFNAPAQQYSSLVTPYAATVKITSMTATQGPVIEAGITGGSGFTFPVFNGDESVKFDEKENALNKNLNV